MNESAEAELSALAERIFNERVAWMKKGRAGRQLSERILNALRDG